MLPSASDILSNPVTLALLTAILVAIALWQRTLGPGDDWVWRLRRRFWPRLDQLTRSKGRAWVREKDADEYVFSTDLSADEIDVVLQDSDYDPNLTSTLKYVTIDADREYEARSYVWRGSLDAAEQTHCYVFDWGGRRHLHQHVEASTTRPRDHHHGDLDPGDPDGRLHDAFDGENTAVAGDWLTTVGDT